MHKQVLAATAAVAALGLVGCAAPVTSTATRTQTQTSTRAASSGGSRPTSPAQTSPATTSPGSASVPPTTVSPISPRASSAAVTATPVDPAAYRGEGGRYFFTSPSGALRCAGSDSAFLVGCQSGATIASLPDCPATPSSSPYVAVKAGGGYAHGCTSQGLFVTPGPKVLPDGHSLTVPGAFTCVSSEAAISCRSLAGPEKFTISMQSIVEG